MATVSFYDDIFDKAESVKEVQPQSIKSLVNEYLEQKDIVTELYECYNTETGKTEYIPETPGGYKVIIIVNGQEETLEYIIEEKDVVSLIFVPQGDNAGVVIGAGIGLGLMLAGGWLIGGTIVAAGGLSAIGAIGASGWAAIAAGGILMVTGALITTSSLDQTKSVESGAESKTIPSIAGAENDLQLGNKYLYTMGKHLLAPRIVGTPWHETRVSDYDKAKDIGQYFHVLYCAGYGPLKLTDFKIGSTVLAYNRNSDSGERFTIMHGLLEGCDETEEDEKGNQVFIPGDITGKWKNNDVKLEILQAGSYNEVKGSNDKYGTIYNQAVAEAEVGAKVLFAYDKDLSSDSIVSLYGRSLPSGYRTNTVKFSASCPSKIQVELDMPSGLYATYNVTSGDNTKPRYQKIPIWIAVQWRFHKNGQPTSDEKSPVGWNSFTKLIFNNGETEESVGPQLYTTTARKEELDINKGKSKDTSESYNNEWINTSAFSLTATKREWRPMTEDEKKLYIERGYIESYTVQEPYSYSYKHWYWKGIFYVYKTITEIRNKDVPHLRTTPSCPSSIRVVDDQCQIFGEEEKSNEKGYDKDDYNVDERRYVFEYEFSKEECAQLAGIEGNVSDCVEVRVIRLTPCYLNEDGTNNKNQSAWTYTDVVEWQYLRTFRFDEDKFREAYEKDSNANPKDFPLRPQPIEEDMDKFVYIALSIKQDVANSAGQSLKKLNVISESFCPKFDYTTQKWYPEELGYVYKKNNDIDDGIYYHDKNCTVADIIPREFVWSSDDTVFYADNDGDIDLSKSVTIPNGVQELVQDNSKSINGTVYYRYRYEKNYWKKVKPVQNDSKVTKYSYNGIEVKYKYFHKHIESGNVKISEISRKDYELHAATVTENDIYYKQQCGNDFIEQIRHEIFSPKGLKSDSEILYSNDGVNFYTGMSESSKVDSQIIASSEKLADKYKVLVTKINGKYYRYGIIPTVLPKSVKLEHIILNTYIAVLDKYCCKGRFDNNFTLTDEVAHKYLSSNTASVFAGALLNNYLGSDAKTYENIDLDSLAEAYEFYEDVTDGSEQVYRIDPDYETSVNLTLASRLRNLGNQSYETEACCSSSTESGTETIVFTPIKNDGKRISDSEIKTIADTFAEKGIIPDAYKSLVLARFHGANSIVMGDKYGEILHLIQEMYYDKNNYYTEEERAPLKLLMTKHVNALSFGLYKDVLENLMLTLEIDFADMKYVVKVLEQMSLPGCQDRSKNWRNQPAVCLPTDGLQHVRFECNGVIDKDIKLETLIQKILLTGRSYVKRSDDNKYEPLIGKPRPYPVNVLNQRNTISRSNSRSFEETPCGFQVSLLDENDGYENIDFYVMDKGEDEKDPTKKIEPFNIDYVTNKWQGRSLALFNLACRIYQQEGYTASVGIIGYSLSLGDTMLIQDDTLLIGTDNGARIMELIEDEKYIYGFVTDEPFDYRGELDDSTGRCKQGCTIVQSAKSGKHRCVTIGFKMPNEPVYIPRLKRSENFNPQREYFVNNGTEYERAIILSAEDFGNSVYSTVSGFNDPEATFYYKMDMKVGLTNVCLFATKVNKDSETLDDYTGGDIYFYKPSIDDLVAFGEINTMTSKATIMSIKPNGKDKFDLTLVPYNEKLYNAGQGIPIFTSNMTNFQSEDDYAFNTDITLSQMQEMAASNIALAEGYNVVATSDNLFFAVDTDGKVLKTQTYEVKYVVTKGQRVLTAVRPDVIPGVSEFRINLPSESIDKFSIDIKPNHYDTLVITAEEEADLTSLSDVDIILNCEDIDVNTDGE